jgi:hypothetical protein
LVCKGLGDIIITTTSGGIGKSTVKFKGTNWNYCNYWVCIRLITLIINWSNFGMAAEKLSPDP